LRSAYHYKLLPGAQGRFHDVPEKNWASHLIDALCYAVAWLETAGLEDVATPQAPLEFTHALGAIEGARGPLVMGGNGRWR
jgi:hypothetical protein